MIERAFGTKSLQADSLCYEKKKCLGIERRENEKFKNESTTGSKRN